MTLGDVLFWWMPIGLVKLIARKLCPVSVLTLKNGARIRMHICLGVLVKARPLYEGEKDSFEGKP